MAEQAVRLAGLTYRYPEARSPALRDLDLEIVPGEFVLCAGRSGSGKSTLLQALCGLVPHYHGGDVSGEGRIYDRDLRDNGPAELGGIVGLVAQDPEAQIVSATVRGELELPLDLRGEPAAARARAIEEVSLALGISGLLDRPVDTLSGGEMQRVCLAAALVLRPRLICLDEPISQLDPVAGEELIALLRRLNEEWGMTVVIAEHRLERCLAAADRVLAIQEGALTFDGPPDRFCEWVVAADAPLAPPGAAMFELAGLRPLPVAVKDARRTLARLGVRATGDPVVADTAPRRSRRARRRDGAGALDARDLWIELDSGDAVRPVLRGVDLTVQPGERVALMGRNGAGKSTLLRAAAGLVATARGTIDTPDGCLLLPQSPTDLFVRDRVSDELPGAEGEAALAAVGLEWARDRDPRDLSGGERERLALALVTAGRSEADGLVCLDEPTRGMDAARKLDLSNWLGELAGAGAAVVVATHDVEFAARFADRVVLLGAGSVIADGPAREVLSGGWYFSTEVARVLGDRAAVTPQQGADFLRRELARDPRERVAP